MKVIDLYFPDVPACENCDMKSHIAKLKGKRWGIYCKYCGSFIKWASQDQKIVINARKEYLEKQWEVAGLKWLN